MEVVQRVNLVLGQAATVGWAAAAVRARATHVPATADSAEAAPDAIRLGAAILTPATAALVAVAPVARRRINKARAAPLLWLSSGEELR